MTSAERAGTRKSHDGGAMQRDACPLLLRSAFLFHSWHLLRGRADATAPVVGADRGLA